MHVGKRNRIACILPRPISLNQLIAMPDFSELVVMCQLVPKFVSQWRLRSAFALFLNIANGSLHILDRPNGKHFVPTNTPLELVFPGNMGRQLSERNENRIVKCAYCRESSTQSQYDRSRLGILDLHVDA